MRELKPGAKVRVEFNAEVIGLADPSNPYRNQFLSPLLPAPQTFVLPLLPALVD